MDLHSEIMGMWGVIVITICLIQIRIGSPGARVP
jgi:hypothetical protein